MDIRKIYQKRIFVLMILLYFINAFLTSEKTIGINKTIGWAWDISYWSLFVSIISIPIFIIGYGLLAFFKYKTNKRLSIVHLIIVLITIILYSKALIGIILTLILLLQLTSFILFSMNIVWSIKNRKQNK